ncbi:MAG: glutamate racemase [Bdellovibrionales bacterium]
MDLERMSDQPIAVFDSGLGGLTVLQTLRHQWPKENYIYLGDTARLPYGTKSADTIRNYLYQNVNYLKQYNPKAIIVACNSASSVLRSGEFSDVPVYGVIEPTIELAASLTNNQRIGVIGTRATITQKTYADKLIEKNPQLQVFQQSCPLFVPLVEEGLFEDPITNLIVYRYVHQLVQANIDTLILGCTHYPLLYKAIQKVTGSDIALVDPAVAIAQYLQSVLPLNSNILEKGSLHLLCTDTAHHFKMQADSILGIGEIGGIEKIDL